MNNIIALVFLYTLDRLQQLDSLCSIIKDFDIYLTVSSQHQNNLDVLKFYKKYKNRIVKLDFHDNYGVDIAPFIKQIVSIDSDKYPYFIKLHSKASKLGAYQHVDWGSILWDSLIGNHKLFNYNRKILQQTHIGAITQPLLIFNNNELNNIQKIKILCGLFNIEYRTVKNSRFMAGSMFMSKTHIFKNIFNQHSKYLDTLMSTEYGKVDDRDYLNGSFCHAMERMFGYIITHQNLKIHKSSLYPIINIYNSKEKILYLHKTYNNIVYLVQDFNIYGYLDSIDQKNFTVIWHHLKEQKATYQYLDNRIATRINLLQATDQTNTITHRENFIHTGIQG